MKRLISLILCLIMVLAAFTACADEEETEVLVSDLNTLVMMVVTEDKVNYTQEELEALDSNERMVAEKRIEQYNAVEEAINRITQSKSKTKLEIVYCTADEYYELLEDKMTATDELLKLKKAAEDAYKKFKRKHRDIRDEAQLYEMFIAESPEHIDYLENPAVLDVPVDFDDSVYPEAGEDQVDIFFLGDYDKYVEYYVNGWLADITSSVSTNEKLKSYIYPAFLDAARMGKSYYAVPNNTLVGEYTVMLVNKEMCDKYSDISLLTDLNSAIALIEDVAKYECGMDILGDDAEEAAAEATENATTENAEATVETVVKNTAIDPVYWDSYRGYTNVHFWSVSYEKIPFTVEELKELPDGNNKEYWTDYSVDSDKFSILGAIHKPNYESLLVVTPNYYSFNNLLREDGFVNQLVALKTLEFGGYYGAEGSTNDFAVGIVKGTGEELDKYSDKYYSVVLEYPVADQQDLFKSMFAVSAFSANPAKCVELITQLNTDETFRNLLQYGVLGANYELDDDECAHRTSDNLYNMDVFKTGNMFVAYPDADKGMSRRTWENAQTQDLDVVSDPTMGFENYEMLDDLVDYDQVLYADETSIDVVNQASEEILAKLEACKTIDELKAEISKQARNIEVGDDTYAKHIYQKAMQAVTADIDPTKGDRYSVYALYYLWCRDVMKYVS